MEKRLIYQKREKRVESQFDLKDKFIIVTYTMNAIPRVYVQKLLLQKDLVLGSN